MRIWDTRSRKMDPLQVSDLGNEQSLEKNVTDCCLFVCLSDGFTPCRHLRPSSGQEHTIVQLIQSGDDDYLMNETRRKPTTGRQSRSLCDKWHGIFYIPSRIDEAGHTKAFGYPVAEHWGESRNVQFRRWDSNRQHISSRTCYQLSHPGSPQRIT